MIANLRLLKLLKSLPAILQVSNVLVTIIPYIKFTKNAESVLKLLKSFGVHIIELNNRFLILKYENLLWRVRKSVLSDLKFGVFLNIVGEPYQYWLWFNKVLNNIETFRCWSLYWRILC